MILDTLDRQLQKGKNEKVIGLMKVELGEKKSWQNLLDEERKRIVT